MDKTGRGGSNYTAQDRQANVAQRQDRDRRNVSQIFDDLEGLSRDSLGLRRAWVRKQEIIDSLREQFHRSEQRNQQLEKQLQDCQARILKFSPASCLSDTTVSGEFIKIRDNLSNWVEEFPDICSDFKRDLPMAVNGFENDPLIFGWPDSYPQEPIAVQSELLMHLVFCRLWIGFFNVPIPGLSSSDENLLAHLQEGMLLLQPKKGWCDVRDVPLHSLTSLDTESINAWRSDTMKAYAASRKYQKGVNDKCSKAIADLRSLFAWFDFSHRINWDNKLARFSEEILGPATGLATKMSSSTTQYKWEWYGEANFPQQVVRKHHLKQFIVQNARTHHKVSIANLEYLPDETPVGKLLVIIFPALFRRGESGHEDFQIEKAVILVHVDGNWLRQNKVENKSTTLQKMSSKASEIMG
ncbi:hypothetical protein BO78DRAFT_408470 [Aspergillus sclerotiicarbonarius CBS 121057]|uniref:Uncharacterized protein n=1 Tax=Aspergillus sclerotiicarbonarius (strain CBS 121057 / IBT 28362) TaxID=1448318 RepID=A0A319EFI5_ASPSB|nr:hypothetical protein BO78DRAFT_408470 [Aspergillus sclerotiicarbonarius CBS 121057]